MPRLVRRHALDAARRRTVEEEDSGGDNLPPQNAPGSPFDWSMDRAMPTTIWLRRSTTPFCWGEY